MLSLGLWQYFYNPVIWGFLYSLISPLWTFDDQFRPFSDQFSSNSEFGPSLADSDLNYWWHWKWKGLKWLIIAQKYSKNSILNGSNITKWFNSHSRFILSLYTRNVGFQHQFESLKVKLQLISYLHHSQHWITKW